VTFSAPNIKSLSCEELEEVGKSCGVIPRLLNHFGVILNLFQAYSENLCCVSNEVPGGRKAEICLIPFIIST